MTYLRLVSHEDRVHCSFLFGKSRVAHLKAISVPRLELSAATVSVRQDKMLKEELEMPPNCESVFWSDSMSVLRYVKNESTRFHMFVANRVAVLREGSSPDQWRYVEGVANPGDCASRALTAKALLSCQRWLLGPEFLWKSEEDWPRNPLSLGCLQDGDPEVKMVYKVCHASVSESEHPLVEYFQRASSWHRLKKSVAWFLRYLGNLKRLSKRGKSREPILSTPILSLPPIPLRSWQLRS